MRVVVIFLFCVVALFGDREGGPYIGGGYAYARIHDKGVYGLSQKEESSFLAYAGAYINRHLSVELNFQNALEFAKKENKKALRLKFLTVATQAHYQFMRDKLDMFAQFGVGEVYYIDKGFAFLYGAGSAYRFNKRLAVKIGYNYYDFGLDKNNDKSADVTINVGVFYCAFEVQF